jgi:hydroxyacylglutathione hydrolase
MMIFRQFYLPSLGHASYLVGDEATGQALILDAQRNVVDYYAAARKQGLRIGYAIDTHGHNDYLSGITEVAARGDVELLGYHEARLGYDHRSVKDGEQIEIGDVAFEIVHTLPVTRPSMSAS